MSLGTKTGTPTSYDERSAHPLTHATYDALVDRLGALAVAEMSEQQLAALVAGGEPIDESEAGMLKGVASMATLMGASSQAVGKA